MTGWTWTRNPFAVLGFLLGNFAALWGFFIAPLYLTGYGLWLQARAQNAQVVPNLPLALPAIGFGLALAGLVLTRPSHREGRVATWIALALNTLPLAIGLAIELGLA